jgi:hypothetical protein
LFDVNITVDCMPHLSVADPSPFYLEVITDPTPIAGNVLTFVNSFATTDNTYCPITNLELLENGSPLAAGSCIEADFASLTLKYANNQHCDLTNLKVRMHSGNFSKDTTAFDVKVMDCEPLLSSTLSTSYDIFEPDVRTVTQTFISSPASYDTSDPTNCPIQSVSLLDSVGNPYFATWPCVNKDGAVLTSYQYGGVECSDTGLTLKITAPGGAVHDSTPFDVSIKPNCTANIAIPSLDLKYEQYPPSIASLITNLSFIVGSDFKSNDTFYCPLTSVSILDSVGNPYSAGCIH